MLSLPAFVIIVALGSVFGYGISLMFRVLTPEEKRLYIKRFYQRRSEIWPIALALVILVIVTSVIISPLTLRSIFLAASAAVVGVAAGTWFLESRRLPATTAAASGAALLIAAALPTAIVIDDNYALSARVTKVSLGNVALDLDTRLLSQSLADIRPESLAVGPSGGLGSDRISVALRNLITLPDLISRDFNYAVALRSQVHQQTSAPTQDDLMMLRKQIEESNKSVSDFANAVIVPVAKKLAAVHIALRNESAAVTIDPSLLRELQLFTFLTSTGKNPRDANENAPIADEISALLERLDSILLVLCKTGTECEAKDIMVPKETVVTSVNSLKSSEFTVAYIAYIGAATASALGQSESAAAIIDRAVEHLNKQLSQVRPTRETPASGAERSLLEVVRFRLLVQQAQALSVPSADRRAFFEAALQRTGYLVQEGERLLRRLSKDDAEILERRFFGNALNQSLNSCRRQGSKMLSATVQLDDVLNTFFGAYIALMNNYLYDSSGVPELWRRDEAEKARLDRYFERVTKVDFYCSLAPIMPEHQLSDKNNRNRASFFDTAATYQLVRSALEDESSESQRRLCNAKKYLGHARQYNVPDIFPRGGWKKLDDIMADGADHSARQHLELLESVIARKLQLYPADLCDRFT